MPYKFGEEVGGEDGPAFGGHVADEDFEEGATGHRVEARGRLVVSFDDGIRCYREVPCEAAYRRQPLTAHQTTELDRVSHLLHNLYVDRNPTTRIYVDPNRYRPHLLVRINVL